MKTITEQELKEILIKHQKWLNDEPGGERANLNFCDLSGADLRYAVLRSANLSGADLSDADLSDADLRYADLSGVDLSDADLRYAVLRSANLSYANLSHAVLSGADLSDAKNVPYIPLACPSDGAFIGWKRVNKYIVKLQIPAEAKRCSATTNKCRCEYAKVLEIQNLDGTKADVEQVDNFSYLPKVTYTIGEMVYPDSYDENRWNECSHGIHFFINRQEAVNYI